MQRCSILSAGNDSPPSQNPHSKQRLLITALLAITVACSSATAADLILSDNFDVTGGNSPGTGFGNNGVNYQIGSRLDGLAFDENSDLRLLYTTTGKPASAYSILDNQLHIADAANSGAFQYSADGTTAFNFGSFLEGQTYEIKLTMTLGEMENTSRRMSFMIADSASPAGGVGGANYGFQIASNATSGGTMSVFERLSASANPGPTAINQSVATGLPFDQPIAFRLVITDSFNYAPGVYESTYELFVNDTSVSSGNFRFNNGGRYLIFDVAPNSGPARYDDFSVTSSGGGGGSGIVNWTGQDGSWTTAGNWQDNTPPGASNKANIANGGTARIAAEESVIVDELQVGNGQASGGATVGSGSVEMTGGSLRAVTRLAVGRAGGDGVMNVTGGLVTAGLVVIGDGAGADGQFSLGGNASLITSAAAGITPEVQIGVNGGTGRLDVSGFAQISVPQGLQVGVGAGSVGTAVFSGTSTSRFNTLSQIGNGGTGVMTVRDDASVIFNGALRVGNTSAGTLNIESGYVAVEGAIAIGRTGGGHGIVNLSGGSLVHTGSGGISSGTNITMGAVGAGNTATLNHTGGVLINDAAELWIAEDNTATVNASGGQAYLSTVRIGFRPGSNGTLNISNTADYTATNVFLSSNGAAGGGTGVLNLNGGTLRANSIQEGPGDAGTVNFNGGRIVARTANANYFSGFENADLRMLAGGLVFDTNGYAITITQAIAGAGGLTKTGKGTLTLSGGAAYQGNTVVEDGVLLLTQPILFDLANVRISGDGRLQLAASGQVDTVGALFLDGVMQDAGTWGSIGSGAQHETAFLLGSGMLLVTVPEPATILLLLSAGPLVFLVAKRRRA